MFLAYFSVELVGLWNEELFVGGLYILIQFVFWVFAVPQRLGSIVSGAETANPF